jgi:hypothetical protein
MKHTSKNAFKCTSKPRAMAQHLPRPLQAVMFAILLLVPSSVRAAECPATSPEDPQERRRLAKEWFAAAEAAEGAGNDAEATRAYACSYKMVAHPFTAFNLGRVAQRTGDDELALKMFKAYVTLKPDAADREDVEAHIKAIEDKMAAESQPSEATSATPQEKPAEAPPEEQAPLLEPPPPPVVAKRPVPEQEPEPEGPPPPVLEWVVGGGAGASLIAGIALNLAARSRMSTCRADATNPNLYGSANDACNSARPLAYASYAMFGLAAAGAAAEALLLVLPHLHGGSPSGGEEAALGLVPLPGGAGLAAHGNF